MPRRRTNLEEHHQQAVIEWAHWAHFETGQGLIKLADYLIAIPNGDLRHLNVAKRLKASGVKPGVSDLFLAVPYNGFGGLWIEMKRPRQLGKAAGKLSVAQGIWLKRMEEIGYAAKVAYGLEDVIKIIHEYFSAPQS